MAKSAKYVEVPKEHQPWCVVHQRKATHFLIREEHDTHIIGDFCCDPKLGGIMIPCQIKSGGEK